MGHPVFSIGNGSVNINASIEAKGEILGFCWNAFSALTFPTSTQEDFLSFREISLLEISNQFIIILKTFC